MPAKKGVFPTESAILAAFLLVVLAFNGTMAAEDYQKHINHAPTNINT